MLLFRGHPIVSVITLRIVLHNFYSKLGQEPLDEGASLDLRVTVDPLIHLIDVLLLVILDLLLLFFDVVTAER